MAPYGNSSGLLTINAYEIRDRSIVKQFRDKEKYLYNYDRPGETEVEEMKRLARTKIGLATYINKQVRRFCKELVK